MDLPSRSTSRFDPGLGPAPTTSQQPSRTARSNRAGHLTSIEVPPYTTSKSQSPSQSPSTTKRTTPPVRRKPLPPSASPSTNQKPFQSAGGTVIAVGLDPDQEHRNPAAGHAPLAQPRRKSSPQLVVRDLDQFPRGLSPNVPQSPSFTPFHKLPPDEARNILQTLDIEHYSPSTISHARNSVPSPASPVTARAIKPFHQVQRSVTMPLKNGGPGQLQMPPQILSNGPATPQRQNSASNKISSFFGWKGGNNNNNYNSSPIAETSPTTISDRSSINGSPNGGHTHATSMSSHYGGKPMPAAIDVPRANAPAAALFSGSTFSHAPPTPAMSAQVEEMEEELRELSEELAGSIRREMELEEQIERLQEAVGSSDRDKRTSDYFSDSGISSTRDQEGNEEVRKLKRQSAQEKAEIKVNVSQKVHEERNKRKALEEHVKTLEAHIQSLEYQTGGSVRMVELQNALEDNRRRLVEEKKHKANYEDLIAALRVDLVQHKNERDNLRDEVVPQLRAQLEGLESSAAEAQKLNYDNARMQQELQALRSGKFESIPEETSGPTTPKMGLSRSASLVRGSHASGSLSRSNSISKKNEPRESREQLAERVKEVEAQRDALHQALKSLLDRQKFQASEFAKRLKFVEGERDRALEASSPRRRGYEKEVTDLRYEINQLRKRADDALEQKWQCEKGLGGLKKDLDRAEQETSSLRRLLAEKDILVPDLSSLKSPHATSASLERAYKELREAQAVSIEKLRELRDISPAVSDDEQINETLHVLLRSMSNAEAERDFAQKQAESYRAMAESLEDANSVQEGENANLANQLKASAGRVEVLSAQVKRQLTANSDLRERLAGAVGKGEREQKASVTRIAGMQNKLKGLEDRLMTAQQQSEDGMLVHEEDVRVIRKFNSNQLRRLKPQPGLGVGGGGLRKDSTSLKMPKTPLSPRSPRLDKTTSGQGMSISEALRTEALETRVKELEAALSEAEGEMGEVVQRMNMAQIEVLELQSARDEAMKQTRMLQNQIIAENENVGSLMKFLPRKA